ncbi:MAG: DoxX family protein [Sphingopyxis sp.]|nr:DoxX family protein [Sphingopyxis sp.]
MSDRFARYAGLPSRVLMATIFLLSGLAKLGAMDQTRGYMEAMGVPGALLVPTIMFEVGAGLLLIAGLGTRYVALALAGFTLVTAMVFHTDFANQIEMLMFLKNVAMAGGFLAIAAQGGGQLSLDRMFAARNPA